MLSRSDRYRANAEKCHQCADAANASGTKRLYGVMANQWRHLAERADETNESLCWRKSRQAHLLREIDKAEGSIRESVALA